MEKSCYLRLDIRWCTSRRPRRPSYDLVPSLLPQSDTQRRCEPPLSQPLRALRSSRPPQPDHRKVPAATAAATAAHSAQVVLVVADWPAHGQQVNRSTGVCCVWRLGGHERCEERVDWPASASPAACCIQEDEQTSGERT
ncbi:hypothetical protein N431DRAFT_57404 [Stipitochalara longipes BDJ]|nr:hypothetical protein N431DRAFT_57404 [Stipitochalara longipes BDJ]